MDELKPMMGEVASGVAGNLALVVKDGEPTLLTAKQICEKLGFSEATFGRRVAAINASRGERGLPELVPAVPGSIIPGQGGEPAKWDLACFLVFQEEEEEVKNRERANARALATARAVPPAAKVKLFDLAVEEMRKDTSHEGTSAIVANAAGFISLLLERVAFMEAQLDRADNQMTVEQYAIRNGFSLTSSQAGQVTRRLHSQGCVEVGKIISPQSGLKACVWSKDILDNYFKTVHGI